MAIITFRPLLDFSLGRINDLQAMEDVLGIEEGEEGPCFY